MATDDLKSEVRNICEQEDIMVELTRKEVAVGRAHIEKGHE